MKLPQMSSRKWLSTFGTLALLYCIVVLSYVVTSPDIRVRCLLLDSIPSEWPSSRGAPATGVVMRKVSLEGSVAPHLPVPQNGDVLVELAGAPIRSFFDFSHQVHQLNAARLKDNGQLAVGADISELMANVPGLLEDSDGQRWVRLKFYTRTNSADSLAAAWVARETYVIVQEIPAADIILSLLWFLLQLAIFAVGALAVWRRPGDGPAVLFFGMCIITLVSFLGGFHWWLVAGQPLLNAPFIACGVFLPVISLHFFLLYPQPRFPLSSPYRRRTLWIGYAIPSVAGVTMLLVLEMARFNSHHASSPSDLASMRWWLGGMRVLIDLFLAFAGLCFVALLLVVSHSSRTSRHPIEKNQLEWLFWAGLLAAIPVGYTLVLALSNNNDHRVEFALGWTTRFSMFLASLAFLCAYAVGIIRYKLMLIDELVSRGVMYYVARVALAIGFGVAVSTVWLVIERLAHPQGSPPGAQRVLALGTILVVIALILLWLRGRIQQTIDRKFFREKYRLHTALERINEAVVRVGDPESLADRMLGSCEDVFQVRSASIYLLEHGASRFRLAAVRGTPNRDVPLEVTLKDVSIEQLLTHAHILGPRQGGSAAESGAAWPVMQKLSAELLFGLELDGKLGVLIALGTKPDETSYSAEDLTFLGALGQITSVALHSARVHRDVGRLNDELQSKVETIAEQERRIAVMESQLNEPGAAATMAHSVTSAQDEEFHREPIVGSSPALTEVLETVKKVAGSESSVLIHGPSGTGKELLAQALHDNSSRRKGPLVRVHCAALSPSLLESELFGHVKGAFTGAHRDRVGRFESAHGGTLFLDEIGDISLETQIKLLRVLQARSFEPVGGTRTIEVDVRLITATHQDLKSLIASGSFREDLYYRLNVISIALPGLADRREDIIELAVHFLGRSSRRLNKSITSIDEAAVLALMHYEWPGNIRELENAIERAAVLTDGDVIRLMDLPEEIRSADGTPSSAPATVARRLGGHGVDSKFDERGWLLTALNEAGGNKAHAARALGIPRSTFFSKLKKHGIG